LKLSTNLIKYTGETIYNSAEGATPRKLSGKRTVKNKFWKEIKSHRWSKALRYQYRWGKIGTHE